MAEPLVSGPVDTPLSLYQGDRFELYFKIYELVWNVELGKYEQGAPVNLTGQTPKGSIKLTRGNAIAVVATFACALANQGTDPGGVLCILTPTEAEKLVDPTYVYDIQLSSDADHITTYLTGTVTVTKQVTTGA